MRWPSAFKEALREKKKASTDLQGFLACLGCEFPLSFPSEGRFFPWCLFKSKKNWHAGSSCLENENQNPFIIPASQRVTVHTRICCFPEEVRSHLEKHQYPGSGQLQLSQSCNSLCQPGYISSTGERIMEELPQIATFSCVASCPTFRIAQFYRWFISLLTSQLVLKWWLYLFVARLTADSHGVWNHLIKQ